jgi:hypothetical protein
MILRFKKIVLAALIACVLLPLFVGIVWPKIIVACDYFAQDGLLLIVFAGPFLVPPETRGRSYFAKVAGLVFVWGLWRLFWFDSIVGNDVPGIGYLLAPPCYGGISVLLFKIRKAFARRKSNPHP